MTDATREKAQIAGLFDRSADAYGQDSADYFVRLAADLVAAARLLPGERVLDVGCGRGANLFAAAERVGPTGAVVGIDLAPAMVARTAAEASRRGLSHVLVRQGDAEAPEELPGTYDAVLAGLVIFFLPDPLAAARAYRRLLRTGGRVSLSTFCEERETDNGLGRVLSTALSPLRPEPAGRPPASEAPAGEPPASEALAGGPLAGGPLAGGPLAGTDREGPTTRLRTRAALAGLLQEAGFGQVSFEERSYDAHFSDAEHFWRWLWSNGARAALEAIPADLHDAAHDAVTSTATRMLGRDGGLTLSTRIRLTTATAA